MESEVKQVTVEDLAKDLNSKKDALIKQMNELEEKSKLYLLKPEEIELLQTFKNFKASLKKPRVFKWMTQPYKEGEE